MLQLALLTAGFVILSGLMAITEAAVLSVTLAEVEVMVEKKLRGARTLFLIKRSVTQAVVVIVVVTNIINVLGPVLVGTRAVRVYGDAVIGIVTAVLTLLTIVLSEIIPKSLGTHYAPRISRFAAMPLRVLIVTLYPFVWIFEHLTNSMKSGERRIGTEEQIRSLVRLGHSAGYIETDETQLVHRAFALNDCTAREIMTPMEQVTSVPADATVSEAARVVSSSQYSRYPVVSQDGSVAGVVISHDLLQAMVEEQDGEGLGQMLRDPMIVDVRTRADDLLDGFRREQFHLAIVLDGGRPAGIVTLEDVLEQLVGEITDEKEE